MLSISVKEFLLWKKRQLSRGGDQQSFALLIDCIGGISTNDLNLTSINPEGNLHLEQNLDFLESIWNEPTNELNLTSINPEGNLFGTNIY